MKTAVTSRVGSTSPRSEISDIVRQIVKLISPRKILLFGSYAWGRPTAASDVDLLIVTGKPMGPDASLRIRRAIRYNVPLDILVHDEQTVRSRIEQGDFFLQEIFQRGRVLYERADR